MRTRSPLYLRPGGALNCGLELWKSLSGVNRCEKLEFMINVGQFASRTCGGPSRRSFLKLGASLPLVLGRPDLLAAAETGRGPRAKSVLLIWLWGAPSHLDTFDPKPEAPSE